jgi:tripartite-type tricarboxylate transporter receptor subunit TctC
MPPLGRRAFVGASAGVLLASHAGAQGAALDTLQIVVGDPAEDTVDRLCHALAEGLRGGSYTREVRIENRPGAEGRTAVETLKGAPADGSVLLGTPAETMSLFPHIYKLNYDPFSDVTAITTACTTDFAFAIGPALPATLKTLEAYLAWCRSDPRQAGFGSPAPGSLSHLIGLLLGKAAGVELWHIPQRGLKPAIDELVAGRLPAACGPLGVLLPHALAGEISLLGVSGAARSRFAPGIPTFAEAGLPDMVFSEWFGFFGPGDTSPRVALRANQALRAALARREVADAMAALALEMKTSTPAEFTQRLQSDHDRLGDLVRRIGFTAKA